MVAKAYLLLQFVGLPKTQIHYSCSYLLMIMSIRPSPLDQNRYNSVFVDSSSVVHRTNLGLKYFLELTLKSVRLYNFGTHSTTVGLGVFMDQSPVVTDK